MNTAIQRGWIESAVNEMKGIRKCWNDDLTLLSVSSSQSISGYLCVSLPFLDFRGVILTNCAIGCYVSSEDGKAFPGKAVISSLLYPPRACQTGDVVPLLLERRWTFQYDWGHICCKGKATVPEKETCWLRVKTHRRLWIEAG